MKHELFKNKELMRCSVTDQSSFSLTTEESEINGKTEYIVPCTAVNGFFPFFRSFLFFPFEKSVGWVINLGVLLSCYHE